jgi:phage gp36-like protein
MTKNLLERYPDICGELDMMVMKEEGISKRANELLNQKKEIDSFIDSLPFRKQKLVITALQCGNRWDVVRRKLCSWKSGDALRKEYERIFEKF